MQKTLIILKPDIYSTGKREEGSELKKPLGTPEEFINNFKSVLKEKNLEIIKEENRLLTKKVVELHYDEHKENIEKFEFLKGYMTSDYCYIILAEGDDAIKKGRESIMQIRQEFLVNIKARYNMTHASDSTESANREIELFF